LTPEQSAKVLVAGWGAAVLDRLRAWRIEQEAASRCSSSSAGANEKRAAVV